VPVDPRPVSKMQHIVEELVQLSSEDYNRENYNR
jgi:hypothetical protein